MIPDHADVPVSSNSRLGSTFPIKPPQLRVSPSVSSVSDEMWSRGSLYEKQIAESIQIQTVAVPQVSSLEASFLHDYGGVVVYDSTARISGDPMSTDPEPVSPGPDFRRKSADLAPESDKRKFLSMKQYSPGPSYRSTFELAIPQDSLRFDSKFESGNLRRAIRRSEKDYVLLIQEDTESRGHTQWFYFSVRSLHPGAYRFQVVNLYKEDSLYNEGMLPAVLSLKKQQLEGQGWHRAGHDVSYTQNSFPRLAQPGAKCFTLTFTYDFVYKNDTVFFAHAQPYTYSDLTNWTRKIASSYSEIARVDTLCQTLAGNTCEILTITSNIQTYKSAQVENMEWNMTASGRKLSRLRLESDAVFKRNADQHSKKKAVVLTARVHPGETAGSFMLSGAVDFLLNSSPEAAFFRSHYIIKIVPMLNPDGVRYGNYRCSLLGVDLNRRWRNPSRVMHPTIYYAKRMIQTLAEEHEIVLFCDFHGHSCKRNAFIYGCSQSLLQISDRKNNIISKMIPLLLCQRNPAVAWKNCHFRLDRTKEATARIVVFNEFKVANSYTLEASFYGPETSDTIGEGRDSVQFQVSDYEKIGKDLMTVSACFCTKSAFLRKLAFIRDLLHRLKSPPGKSLEKSKSEIFSQGEKPSQKPESDQKQGVRSSLDQYGNGTKDPGLEGIDPSPESPDSDLMEKQLWETLFEVDDKVGEGSGGSDSSGSEEDNEDMNKQVIRLTRPLRRSRGKQEETKTMTPGKRQNPLLKETSKSTYFRKYPSGVSPPKLYKSDRTTPAHPVLYSNRGVVRNHGGSSACAFRSKKDTQGNMSPNSSSGQLTTCFEPFTLHTDSKHRSQAILVRANRLIPKPPTRARSLKRYYLNDAMQPMNVGEYVRKAMKGRREKSAEMKTTEEIKKESIKKGLIPHDRGVR